MKFGSLIFVVGLAVSSCTSEQQSLDSGVSSDSGVLIDLGTPDMGAMLTWTFVREEGQAPSIELRSAAVEEDSLRLNLVGSSLEAVHGVAVRVRYDPQVLAFTSAQPLAVFSGGLFEAEEGAPGELVFAISAIGRTNGEMLNDTPLAELAFSRQAQSEVELQLRRGMVLSVDGAQLDARFGGGRLMQR